MGSCRNSYWCDCKFHKRNRAFVNGETTSNNARRGPGPIARGIAAAGIIGAVGSSTVNPHQSDTTAQKNWGDSNQRAEGARQGRTQRSATRDQGNRNGGSGQSS